MAGYTTDDIRNIAFVGHSGGGKTSIIERLLHDAGVIGRIGTVQDKNTICDFEENEKELGRSLAAAIVHFDYNGKRFNVIDTPGSPDFIGHAIPCLPAVETMAVVVDAAKGIQTVTRRMMNIGGERNLPRVIIVNKIDHAVGELEELVGHIKEAFGAECIPANLPSAGGTGVIDVLGHGAGDTVFSSVSSAHTAIVDQCVEVDESLMEQYLESGEVGKGDLHNAFEKSLRDGHLVPILFCSSTSGAGMAELLTFLSDWCPSPTEGNPRPFEITDGDGVKEWHATPSASEKPVAHVFKVAADPFVGKLAVFRVHQGTLKANSQVHRNDEKKPIRIGHLLMLRGKEHFETTEAIPGDIVAVAKVEEIKLNDVLHEMTDIDGLHLRPLPMPKPMLGLAIEPKSRGDETKLGSAIQKLQEGDPTFVVERVPATQQTVARGLGDLHLRVIIDRMKSQFGVEVETAPPKVAYKETISGKAEGHHRHKKQTGGAGQFGEVYLRVEPINGEVDTEAGFEFVDDTFGGSVPKQFMPAIEKGIRAVLLHGAIAGYPMTGVKASVYDGKHHPVDSKEIAFVTAGKKAFINAVQKAKPVLLEPFVDIEVTAPSQYMGDLTSDLISKRGRINGSDILPGDMCAIHATAPLAELMAYTSQLKSITAGAGAFTMDYSHDEATPANVQAEVIAAFKPREEED